MTEPVLTVTADENGVEITCGHQRIFLPPSALAATLAGIGAPSKVDQALRKQAIGRILNVLRNPISLLSSPTRKEVLELAARFEVTAADLLERATQRAKDT